MPHVVKSTILDAPTDAVWDVLRDFNGHDRWHPAVATSTIERAQSSDRIGCVRRFKLQGRLGAARAIAGAVRSRADFQLLPARYADPDVQLCRACAAAAGHRRRPHLLALGVALHDPARRRRRASPKWSAKQIYQAGFEAIRRHLKEPHERGDMMPVTVKTFATLERSGGGAVVGPRRALSRRRHAGDAGAQRRRCLGLDGRARDRPRPDARSTQRARASRSAPASPCAQFFAERELAFLHAACALDRRTGGAQHGHGRRQSVRANALWRFCCRAACARRDGLRAGRLRRARHADRGISGERATGTPARSCSSSLAIGRRAPTRSAIRKVSRVKPKGGSVLTIAALCRSAADASRARASRYGAMAATPIRAKAAERALEGRTLDAATSPPRSRPPPREPRRPTTRSPAPGIAAKSSACICAVCCSGRNRTRMAKTALQFRHNGRDVAIFVDGGTNLLSACATESAT